MSIKEYHRKRDFSKTSEPKDSGGSNNNLPIFVVQKHAASHLHYDLRLEHKGVLLSWAVPKGPTLNPDEKRLAVKVEDHPYDYKDFEGIIPENNYGAGTVIVWDTGNYYVADPAESKKEIEKKIVAALKKGIIKFHLNGQKLQGEFALVRTKYERNSWLLIKKRDASSTKKDILKNDKSVLSGKTISQLKFVDKVDLKAVNKLISKVSNAKKAKVPQSIKPMLATLYDHAFDDKDWLYEIKWDGYRTIAICDNQKITLYSRNQQIFNEKYPEIVASLNQYNEQNFIFDGEIVVLNDAGIPQFEWLQHYNSNPRGKLVYYIFDLLYWNQFDLKSVPLIQRKKLLKNILLEDSVIRYCDHIVESGTDFFEMARKNGLEGIIGKNGNSSYQQGKRSKDWLKIKVKQQQNAIIVGYTKPRSGRKYFGSLILAAFSNEKLVYIGHCGTGFSVHEQEKIFEMLAKITVKKCPFDELPETNMPAIWVKPLFVCELNFSEWTESNVMRIPVFNRILTDIKLKDVKIPASNIIELSHPKKIFFPKEGYTKLDILEYYNSIAETILPHLQDRPESLHRFPDGIAAKGFYQKDVRFEVPDFVYSTEIFSKSNEKMLNYLICNNLKTLQYMVNLGSIELNPWLSRVAHLDNPDFAVLDLDPGDAKFKQVVQVALFVHELFARADSECYCKTSGLSGLHIYIPLNAKYDYEFARNFVLLIAKIVNSQFPNFTTLERSPKKRGKKIYLDYLQNRKGQTIAAPYSVRPSQGAPVSTPLSWSEIDNNLNPKNFHIKNIPSRLKSKGDIFQNVLTSAVDIEKCLISWKDL